MTVLFVGAHPDDLEIGAGGLISRLHSRGVEVHAANLTAETPDRSHEATRALGSLGIPQHRITQFDYPDGDLKADSASIERLYTFGQSFERLELVVTHSANDSHPDHRAANLMARSAFRCMRFLYFSILRSVELPSFTPTYYLPLSDNEISAKERALRMHKSQADRLARLSLPEYEYALGAQTGYAQRCEAFETMSQWDSPSELMLTLEASDLSTAGMEAIPKIS